MHVARILRRAAIASAAALFCASALLASCGSAMCPMDPQSLNLPLPRQFTLDFSFQYIDQDQVRIGRDEGTVGQIPSHHDEVRTLNRAAGLLANYATSDRLVLSAYVPFVSRYHEHIEDTHVDSHELAVSPKSVRHDVKETWSFDDLGDASVTARYRMTPKLWATGGVELPTGERRPKNEDGEIAETTLAPGSGSVDLFGGLVFQSQVPVPTLSHGVLGNAAVMPFFAGASFRWNGRGTDDYQLGEELFVNAGVLYPVFTNLQVIAQVNAEFRSKDDVGDTDEDPDHTGRSSVYFSPGLRVGLPGGIAAYWIVQIPVYQRVNGIQLASDYNLLGGVQARF
jgi:hypothetical protein